MNILHLSHMDVNCDSKILKDMLCLTKSNSKFNIIKISHIMQDGAIFYKQYLLNINLI